MPKAEYYNGSKGPVLIAEMPYKFCKNARDKLARNEPDRADEIEAMDARLAALGVEYRAKLEAERTEGNASAERIREIDEELARLDAEAA